jgi:hypothetical protein
MDATKTAGAAAVAIFLDREATVQNRRQAPRKPRGKLSRLRWSRAAR